VTDSESATLRWVGLRPCTRSCVSRSGICHVL